MLGDRVTWEKQAYNSTHFLYETAYSNSYLLTLGVLDELCSETQLFRIYLVFWQKHYP